MTILELKRLEDLEGEEMRLLAAVMLSEEIVESAPTPEEFAEQEWDLYFASLARQYGVERETPERLAELQGELAMLLEAGCSSVEAQYLMKLEGREN